MQPNTDIARYEIQYFVKNVLGRCGLEKTSKIWHVDANACLCNQRFSYSRAQKNKTKVLCLSVKNNYQKLITLMV